VAAKKRLVKPVKSNFAPKTAGTFRMYHEAPTAGEVRAPARRRGPVKSTEKRTTFRLRLKAIKHSLAVER
jgi:hypothetical protein